MEELLNLLREHKFSKRAPILGKRLFVKEAASIDFSLYSYLISCPEIDNVYILRGSDISGFHIRVLFVKPEEDSK